MKYYMVEVGFCSIQVVTGLIEKQKFLALELRTGWSSEKGQSLSLNVPTVFFPLLLTNKRSPSVSRS